MLKKFFNSFLSAKRFKVVYFKIAFSNEKKVYRDYTVRKRSFITFLGFPTVMTKEIIVPAHASDVSDYAI